MDSGKHVVDSIAPLQGDFFENVCEELLAVSLNAVFI
jgi:hypothetical protein